MTAIDLASEGLWTDALSIASQGFLSSAVAVVALLGGGGGAGAGKTQRRAAQHADDDDWHLQRAAIARQNNAILAAIMAFVCSNE